MSEIQHGKTFMILDYLHVTAQRVYTGKLKHLSINTCFGVEQLEIWLS